MVSLGVVVAQSKPDTGPSIRYPGRERMYSRLIARGVYHVLIRLRVIGPTLAAWMIVG